MSPKNKLKKPNEPESDQSDSSESSIESDNEYSGNEVNNLTKFYIYIYLYLRILVQIKFWFHLFKLSCISKILSRSQFKFYKIKYWFHKNNCWCQKMNVCDDVFNFLQNFFR